MSLALYFGIAMILAIIGVVVFLVTKYKRRQPSAEQIRWLALKSQLKISQREYLSYTSLIIIFLVPLFLTQLTQIFFPNLVRWSSVAQLSFMLVAIYVLVFGFKYVFIKNQDQKGTLITVAVIVVVILIFSSSLPFLANLQIYQQAIINTGSQAMAIIGI